MQQFINIFDLDCTLIDSSHRINEQGDYKLGLDLDYWIENSTYEMIMKDKLLPLMDLYREFEKTNFTNIAVTARDMNASDFEFLERNGLHFHMVLHREDSKELDHVLKEKKIQELFDKGNYIPFCAFDDKEANLEIFRKFGFRCFNALELNKQMSGQDVPCNHKYMKGTDSFFSKGQRED
jgi:FMN phosphatase YigB (HAD superfamily)